MNPIEAPTIGPSIIAPIITGKCKIVNLKSGNGIKPRPVTPKNKQIPDSIAITTIFLTF